MNIEELAKTDNIRIPLKKKGYDDIEISDLSDDGEKKSAEKAKKLRMSQLITRNKAENQSKTSEEKLKFAFKSEDALPQVKNEPAKSYEEKEKEKKEKEKPSEEATDVKTAKIVAVPKYTGPSAMPAGADEKQKKACCVLL